MKRLSSSISGLINHEESAMNSMNGHINSSNINRVRKEIVKDMRKHPRHNIFKSKSKEDSIFQRSVEAVVSKVGTTIIDDVLGPFPRNLLKDKGVVGATGDKDEMEDYAPLKNQQDRAKDSCYDAFGLWLPTVWQSERCPVSFPWSEIDEDNQYSVDSHDNDSGIGLNTGTSVAAATKNRDIVDEGSLNHNECSDIRPKKKMKTVRFMDQVRWLKEDSTEGVQPLAPPILTRDRPISMSPYVTENVWAAYQKGKSIERHNTKLGSRHYCGSETIGGGLRRITRLLVESPTVSQDTSLSNTNLKRGRSAVEATTAEEEIFNASTTIPAKRVRTRGSNSASAGNPNKDI